MLLNLFIAVKSIIFVFISLCCIVSNIIPFFSHEDTSFQLCSYEKFRPLPCLNPYSSVFLDSGIIILRLLSVRMLLVHYRQIYDVFISVRYLVSNIMPSFFLKTCVFDFTVIMVLVCHCSLDGEFKAYFQLILDVRESYALLLICI